MKISDIPLFKNHNGKYAIIAMVKSANSAFTAVNIAGVYDTLHGAKEVLDNEAHTNKDLNYYASLYIVDVNQFFAVPLPEAVDEAAITQSNNEIIQSLMNQVVHEKKSEEKEIDDRISAYEKKKKNFNKSRKVLLNKIMNKF
jgi:hypothetical protein